MTSTNRGDFGAKSSSRVLRPPGGGTNINIFSYGDEPVKSATNKSLPECNQPQPPTAESSLPQQPVSSNEAETTETNAKEFEDADEEKPSEESADVSAAAAIVAETPASDPKQTTSNSLDANPKKGQADGRGFNPITGQPYNSSANAQTRDSARPQIRVRQPPGGASSKLW